MVEMVEMVEGARYRRRDGLPSGRLVQNKDPSNIHNWHDGEYFYCDDGHAFSSREDHFLDLVEMVHDPRKPDAPDVPTVTPVPSWILTLRQQAEDAADALFQAQAKADRVQAYARLIEALRGMEKL